MDNSHIKTIEFNKTEWSDYINPGYVSVNSDESFAEVLVRYINESYRAHNISQKDISSITGIDNALLSKYKKGYRKPTLNAIILMSLAMGLTPDRSNYLLYLAGYVLNNSKLHRIYNLFLSGCAFNKEYSISNCNAVLSGCGYPVLSARKQKFSSFNNLENGQICP